jgi:hypothetical protein
MRLLFDGVVEEILHGARTAIYAHLSAEFAELANLSAGGVSVRKLALSSLYGKLGSNGHNGHATGEALNGTSGNHKVGYAADDAKTTAKVVAASAPPPKKKVSPEQKLRQQLHGKYVGMGAHAPKPVAAQARKIFAAKGVRAAISYLETERNKRKAKSKKK